tara:strand:+ start:1752 stop:2120 length:369 start_codon:yes stop_codon:yes gene_type:complete
MASIQDVTNEMNDIAVLRLEMKSLEEEREKIISEHERLQEIEAELSTKKFEKEKAQHGLIETMRAEGLKSYKTDYGTFSRVIRYSLDFDKAYKKDLEERLKKGEEIPCIQLRETEYISIRST